VDGKRLAELTSEIVAVYVANHTISRENVATLITDVYSVLARAAKAGTEPVSKPTQPAIPIRKSVTPDHIICLEDGKKLKALKRHLRDEHGMTPEEYRQKWDLKIDYPMVAPNYANTRSEMAKAMGLGRKPAVGAGEAKSSEAAAAPAADDGAQPEAA
jgi:predicted transcriptional regulator